MPVCFVLLRYVRCMILCVSSNVRLSNSVGVFFFLSSRQTMTRYHIVVLLHHLAVKVILLCFSKVFSEPIFPKTTILFNLQLLLGHS